MDWKEQKVKNFRNDSNYKAIYRDKAKQFDLNIIKALIENRIRFETEESFNLCKKLEDYLKNHLENVCVVLVDFPDKDKLNQETPQGSEAAQFVWDFIDEAILYYRCNRFVFISNWNT